MQMAEPPVALSTLQPGQLWEIRGFPSLHHYKFSDEQQLTAGHIIVATFISFDAVLEQLMR
jgi:hypothetical protein